MNFSPNAICQHLFAWQKKFPVHRLQGFKKSLVELTPSYGKDGLQEKQSNSKAKLKTNRIVRIQKRKDTRKQNLNKTKLQNNIVLRLNDLI